MTFWLGWRGKGRGTSAANVEGEKGESLAFSGGVSNILFIPWHRALSRNVSDPNYQLEKYESEYQT